MDTKADATGTPTAADLVDEYMKGTVDTLPECPSLGAYTIGTMAVRPICSKGAQTAGEYDDHILK